MLAIVLAFCSPPPDRRQLLPRIHPAHVPRRHRRLGAAGRHRPVRPVRIGGAVRAALARGQARISRASARFANALIETSLPSVIIFALSHHMEPPPVLGFWPPMLYFVFILLSTLRLDFWLSLWTGGVAAVQLFALAAWLLPIEPLSDVPERGADLQSQPQHRAAGVPASSPASWPAACAGSSRRRSPRRRRATGSPTCSASTSRRPWSTSCSPP